MESVLTGMLPRGECYHTIVTKGDSPLSPGLPVTRNQKGRGRGKIYLEEGM